MTKLEKIRGRYAAALELLNNHYEHIYTLANEHGPGSDAVRLQEAYTAGIRAAIETGLWDFNTARRGYDLEPGAGCWTIEETRR